MSDKTERLEGQKGKLKEGVKYDDGKIRWDLIPLFPLYELAFVYTIGAKKYEDENWRKGMGYKKMVRAIMNHLTKWLAGHERDAEDGQHHLASVAWSAFSLMEYERLAKENPDFAASFDNRSDLGAIPNENDGDRAAKIIKAMKAKEAKSKGRKANGRTKSTRRGKKS
jgi:hypothetical protein